MERIIVVGVSQGGARAIRDLVRGHPAPYGGRSARRCGGAPGAIKATLARFG